MEGNSPSNPVYKIEIEPHFKSKLKKLVHRNPDLERAFDETIKAVCKFPLGMGKRSKIPTDTRHIHVKNHWVLFWRVKGNTTWLLDCGHHDDFFRR